MKKWLSGLLSAALCVCIAAGSAALAPSAAEEERVDVAVDATASALTGVTRAKNNINGNSYNRYNSVVRSYLRPTSDGFMRIYGSDDGTLLAEYYDSQYRFVSNRTVACGLPLFGGFYEYGNRYYVLTGDKNLNEDDSKEVFRITCFDKDWKPVGKDSLYGVNTYVPFEAGRASFAVCGSQLFIRSCHTMYYYQGANHQANLTLVFDMKRNIFKDYFCEISNITQSGFASHSFNQFIAIDTDGTVVCLDQGDEHPREAALGRYIRTADQFVIHEPGKRTYEYTPILSYYGTPGDNTTAAMVGGLAVSSTSYLTVGTSAGQDENYRSNRAFNAYISVTDKTADKLANAETKLRYLTSFTEEDERYASNPQLVKVSDNLFLMMWNEFPVTHSIFVVDIPQAYDETYLMKYVFVNGKGEPVSDIMTAPVNQGIFVSECEPIVCDNKILWFVCDAYQMNQIIEMDLSGNITVHEHVIPEDFIIYPIDLSKATVSLRSFDTIPDTVELTPDNIDDYVVVTYRGYPLEYGRDFRLASSDAITCRTIQGTIMTIQLRLATVSERSYLPMSYTANWSVVYSNLYLNRATRTNDGVQLEIIARRGVGYHIYRKELGSSGDYELIATVRNKLLDTCLDTTAERSKGYTYMVREYTFDQNGREVLSPPSSNRSVSPAPDVEEPTEPPYDPSTVTMIRTVSVNIPEPEAGAAIGYSASVPAGNGYALEDYSYEGQYLDGVSWQDENDIIDPASGRVFEAGESYTFVASIILTDVHQYAFDADNLTVYVNGVKGGYLRFTDENYLVYRVFSIPDAPAAAYLLGDADGSGDVTILDATAIQRWLVKLPTASFGEKPADADENGIIEILDATAIQRWLVKLSTNPNIGKTYRMPA